MKPVVSSQNHSRCLFLLPFSSSHPGRQQDKRQPVCWGFVWFACWICTTGSSQRDVFICSGGRASLLCNQIDKKEEEEVWRRKGICLVAFQKARLFGFCHHKRETSAQVKLRPNDITLIFRAFSVSQCRWGKGCWQVRWETTTATANTKIVSGRPEVFQPLAKCRYLCG